MSNDQIPLAGGKLTKETFANLALAVAPLRPSMTLVLTAMDEQSCQMGYLVVVDDVPPDPEDRDDVLSSVIWDHFGERMGFRMRIAAAFVELKQSGDRIVDSMFVSTYRVDGLN